MNRNQVVALIGDTLLTDAIEASLAERNDLWVLRMATADDIPSVCRFFIPDFIIADLNTVALASVITYMTQYPGTSLLGMESRSDRVIALSCDQFTVQSAADLARVIRQTLHQEEQAYAPASPLGAPYALRFGDAAPV
jgi:hypothetical protein